MEYIDWINKLLKPEKKHSINVLDLFAGCGGLALGFEAHGFKTYGYEMNKSAAMSYEKNLKSTCENIKLTKDYVFPKADIVIGGPPCQPFSVGGYQMGIEDARDGFPIFIEAIKQTQPKVFLFENVRGLLYSNKWYFEIILKSLRDLGYIVDYKLVNAVHYKVPQNRERLIVVGHKSQFTFPTPSNIKTTVSEAIGDIMYTVPDGSKFLTPSMDQYIAKYEKASSCVNPRDLYPNKPARTLTCRNLAGATGDMQRVRLKDGRRRRLTIREAARLQTFPDWFHLIGNDTDQYNQIGNAVPPLLAYFLAEKIFETYNMRPKTAKQIIEINEQRNNSIGSSLTLF
ncbi:MAG: DNA cytosine methyltransferase [Bacteroidota bacterium]